MAKALWAIWENGNTKLVLLILGMVLVIGRTWEKVERSWEKIDAVHAAVMLRPTQVAVDASFASVGERITDLAGRVGGIEGILMVQADK
jgi:hypothetical protein